MWGGTTATAIANIALVITVVVTAMPTPALATPTPILINDDKGCGDFRSWEEAQAFFIDADGPDQAPHFHARNAIATEN